jgi:hypothetical protein
MAVPTEVNCYIQLTPELAPVRVHCDALKPYWGKVPRAWVNYEETESEESSDESGSDTVVGSSGEESSNEEVITPTNEGQGSFEPIEVGISSEKQAGRHSGAPVPIAEACEEPEGPTAAPEVSEVESEVESEAESEPGSPVRDEAAKGQARPRRAPRPPVRLNL